VPYDPDEQGFEFLNAESVQNAWLAGGDGEAVALSRPSGASNCAPPPASPLD